MIFGKDDSSSSSDDDQAGEDLFGKKAGNDMQILMPQSKLISNYILILIFQQ